MATPGPGEQQQWATVTTKARLVVAAANPPPRKALRAVRSGWGDDDKHPACKFFEMGNCRYGSNCKFRHDDGAPEQKPKYFCEHCHVFIVNDPKVSSRPRCCRARRVSIVANQVTRGWSGAQEKRVCSDR